jgi:hypothetical protein
MRNGVGVTGRGGVEDNASGTDVVGFLAPTFLIGVGRGFVE